VSEPTAAGAGSPRVTVVMPVLNEGKSVEGAIASVLRQSVQELELLVVDGNSTDDTAEKVRRIGARDSRVILLGNPLRTIPAALNIALANARGEFLARVDGHASVNDTYLQLALTRLDEDPTIAAVGGRRIGVAATSGGVAVATALSSKFGVGDSINHYADVAQQTDHASFGVFRVSVLREVGGWDEQLLVNEDVDLDHRILQRGHHIWFDPQMSIFWHVRESVPALARQYRRYGRGKAAMVLKNGRTAVKVRHLAPPALVVNVGLGAGMIAVGHPRIGLALLAPYAAALTAATVVTTRSAEPVQAPPRHDLTVGETVTGSADTHMPRAAGRTAVAATSGAATAEGRRANPLLLVGSFAAMHLGWGLGFLEGALLRLQPASASAKIPAVVPAQSARPAADVPPDGAPDADDEPGDDLARSAIN